MDVDHRAAGALIQVDVRRLERALANLIDNAETHGGGVTRLLVEGRTETVRLVVEDSGPGVPADDVDRIFERFARGSRSRRSGKHGGSGLGLALAYENIRLQGGAIWVESRPGGGARFVVELGAEFG